MKPFLLVSAIVASYMCIVQGPCKRPIQNWINHGSRQFVLDRLRYRGHDKHGIGHDYDNHGIGHGHDNHGIGHGHDKTGIHYHDKHGIHDHNKINHDKFEENRDYLHSELDKFYEINKGHVGNDKKVTINTKGGPMKGDVIIEYREKDHENKKYDPKDIEETVKLKPKDHDINVNDENTKDDNKNTNDDDDEKLNGRDENVNDNTENRNRDRNNRLRQYHRDQSSCRTPSGGSGNCISLYECQPLMAIINKAQKSQQEVDLLKKSKCGFQGQTPKVCCADDSCVTPDGDQGRCVNLYSCPHIASMLTPPVPQETVAFVQRSRCQGSDQYSVCCGPPRTNTNPNPTPGVCTPLAAPPDPRTKCCGYDVYSGDKIVGGNATAVDQYPWMVIIEYVKTSSIKLLCGAALISGRYVLTAGHCVAGPVLDVGTPRNVRLGEYDITNNPNSPDCVPVAGGGEDCTVGVTIIPIERTIPHPDYNPSHSLRRNDIALIRLRSLAPYTEFIRPICLPSTDLTLSPPPQLTLFAAGWGAVNATLNRSNVKQHVDLPFISQSSCQPSYSSRKVQLWQGQMCAGGERDKDSCKGDSGGPLMYENPRRQYEVIGVVSFGPTPCGAENIPGVYTKVFHYLPWIRSQIKP